MFWPFSVWIISFSDLKIFANSQPSFSNFKSISRSLETFFLTVGQNNFVNKIPKYHLFSSKLSSLILLFFPLEWKLLVDFLSPLGVLTTHSNWMILPYFTFYLPWDTFIHKKNFYKRLMQPCANFTLHFIKTSLSYFKVDASIII